MKTRLRSIRLLKLVLSFFSRKRTVVLVGGSLILGVIFIAFVNNKIGLFKASSLDPAAYWKFDEGNGTSVNDSSGSNHTGNLGTGSSAPTWKSADFCVNGSCLLFDGLNDSVNAGDVLDFTGNTEMTVSAWVKILEVPDARAHIISKYDAGTAGQWYLAIDGNSKVTFLRECGLYGETGVTPVALNTWNHVVGVYDGTNIQIYLNGILDKTAVDSCSISDTSVDVKIGAGDNGTGTEDEFKGFIDEVKVYPYARTPDQIKLDFQGGGSQGSSIRIGDTDYSFLNQGLITYWKMNDPGIDAEGETISNSSGTSHDITLYGDNSTGDNGTGMDCTTEGKYGTGCEFDGEDDYIDLNNFNYFDGTSQMTVAMWIRPDFTPTEANFRYLWSPANFNLRFNPNRDNFTLGVNATGGSLSIDTQNLTWVQNTWHHIAITYNGTNAIIYWDGEEISRGSTSGVLNPSGQAEYLGAMTASSYKWLGGIDEVRTYTRALSAQEIRSLYNWSPGPIGYWKLDEGSGTTAYDSSGNGNNSSAWSGNTKWVQGKYGSATSHDGSGDRITIPSSSTLDYQPMYTWSVWLKPTAGSYEIFDKAADTNNGWKIGSNGNKYALTIYYTGDDLMCTVPAANMAVGEWQHIAWTWDGTSSCSGVKFYKNGKIISFESTTTPSGTREIDTGKQILIGGNGYTDYPGMIDDFKIYNYVRTQEQILEDMNAGHPAVGTPVGSAIVQYKFDEGYGDTVHDSGPNGYDGDLGESDTVCPTASNDCPTWTNEGKVGKALSFDGEASDDVIELPVGTSLRGKSEFSISVWVKTADLAGVQQTIYEEPEAGSTNSRVKLAIDSDNKFVFSGRASQFGLTVWVDSTTSLSTDTWYHVVAIFDANTDIHKLFINGIVQESSVTESAIPDTAPFINPRIGARVEVATHGFEGVIDEFALYPFALTEEHVKLLSQGGKSMVLGVQNTGVGGTTPSNTASREYCVPGDTSTCAEPFGEWLFNEGVGSTAYDTSGNGYDGTLGSDVTASDWVAGKVGRGLNFSGSSTNDVVTVNNGASVRSKSQITIEMWIKPSVVGTYNRALYGETISGSGSNRFSFYITSGGALGLGGRTWDGGTFNTWVNTSNGLITADNWYHVVGVFNSDSNLHKIYINGQLSNSNSADYAAFVDTAPQSGPHIGGQGFLSINEMFRGTIDQVRIYDYERTQAQIAWDYNKGAPVAHYRFDECQGTTANDSSGNGHAGTITIGGSGENTVGNCSTASTAWGDGASGKLNSSLSFDGTDDYVSVPYSSDLGITSDITITAWVKRSSLSQKGQIVAKTDGSNYDFEFGIEPDGSNSDKLFFYGDAPGYFVHRSNRTVSDSNWHHVVFSRKGSTTTFYIDGISAGDDSVSGNFNNNSIPLYIGGDNATAWFNGQIDDVRIYNYALTAHQIKELYSGGAVVFK